MYRESLKEKKSPKNQKSDNEEEFLAKLDVYTRMAHFVGKELNIRPAEIMKTWSVPELIVAYGEYANEIAQQNLAEWKAMGDYKTPRPNGYQVMFISID